jgi:UDP-glucuronate 4-epimerase
MKIVVTGVAGFIGSHIAQRWLDLGADVIGIDDITIYYGPSQKRANLAGVKSSGGALQFVEGDLLSIPLNDIFRGCDVLYHQAAQPGVRDSWSDFEPYVRHNVLATQAQGS